jgi:hypothetical protein
MMKKILSLMLPLLACASCTKFDDASPTERNTFIHFYSSGTSFNGSLGELDTDGGYILSGEIPHLDGGSDALIIKTDAKGYKTWEVVLKNTQINSIKPQENGYILVGDGIELNPDNQDISEQVNTQAKLIFMNTEGDIQKEYTKRSQVTVGTKTFEVDYHGNAFAFDSKGNVLLLGSYKEPGSNQHSFVLAYDAQTGDELWNQTYGLLDRDYVNCNELFTNSGKLVWASKTFRQTQNISKQYVSISYVGLNSTFENNSLFGENDAKNHTAENIQASFTGYAVTGTYANPDGTDGNIYFMRINLDGNVIPNSTKYFDGITPLDTDTDLNNRDGSSSADEGLAVTAVAGGYVIAGKLTSTTTIGNGGTDIVLIKVDLLGNFIWSKIIGGRGDEIASSIRETPDGGLLICGTNSINGLSSIMLMKTDSKGELIN